MIFAVFLLTFCIYAITLCPSVYVEGSGELIGATQLLGTAHPTGYPLFTLVGRVVCAVLPFSSPAVEVNLFSALCGALSTASLSALLRARGLMLGSASAGGMALGLSATYWSQAVVAEVYTMFTLFGIATIAAALQAARVSSAERQHRWLLLTGYVSGIAVTSHLQAVLLLPGILLITLRAHRLRSTLLRAVALVAAGTVLGFSATLYLPVRNGLGAGFHWGPLDSGSAMWAHITGELYRGSFLFSLPWSALWLNVQRLANQITVDFTALLLPVALWGGVRVWRVDRDLAVVTSTSVVANFAVALNYDRDPNGIGVFFLLAVLCLALWFGFGIDDLCRRLRYRPALLVMPAVAALLFVANRETADRSHSLTPDQYGRAILRELPAEAVLITEGDDASYIVDYLSRVEGLRPDVDLLQRQGRGTGLVANLPSPYEMTRAARQLQTEMQLISSGRPVHYLHARAVPLQDYRFAPWGLTYQLVSQSGWPSSSPPGSPRPQIPVTRSRDPWVRKLESNYWFMVAEHAMERGETAAVVAALDSSAARAPQSHTANFNAGLKLLQINQLDRAFPYAERALQLRPMRPQGYQLVERILQRQGRAAAVRDLERQARRWGVVP
ncbi:MAG: DUF2723 domain-containing protein [Candidatus Latescibacterota bacterium]|nr:DUF2723 domain-containing protein [Candidatus Latescibacterota bacterium]